MAVEFVVNGDTITTVRIESVDLHDSAALGAVGTSNITIDDYAGTLSTRGWKEVSATEDDCSSPLIVSGFVGARTIRRGTNKTAGGRHIEMGWKDLNDLLSRIIIRGVEGKRPREEMGDRLTWLLGSTFLAPYVADNGFVDYPTLIMDKNDYRTQFPIDVLNDCATRLNYNFFVYPDPTTGDPSLWFDDSNTSTNYSSTLRISDIASEIDWVTTFPAGSEAALEIDPESVYSGIEQSYQGGRVFRARTATTTAFGPRHGVAPSSSVKKRARAIAQADKYLGTHRSEDFHIEDTVLVPSSKLNLLRSGMRVQAKYEFMGPEGYDSYNWWRVLDRHVKPVISPGGIPEAPDEPLYQLGLRLSPQEEGCSVEPTFVQYAEMDGDPEGYNPFPDWQSRFDLQNPSAVGNLLVLMLMSDGLNSGTFVEVPAGWSSALFNINQKADDSGLWCHVIYKRSAGEQSVSVKFTGATTTPRGIFIEYAGLTNPVLDSQTSVLREVGLGFANTPDIPYPAGAALVLCLNWMRIGPESGDELTVGGTGITLRTPQNSDGSQGSGWPHGFFGAPCLAIADAFRAPAGSSGSFTDWQFFFTNDEETMTVGLVFVGENC